MLGLGLATGIQMLACKPNVACRALVSSPWDSLQVGKVGGGEWGGSGKQYCHPLPLPNAQTPSPMVGWSQAMPPSPPPQGWAWVGPHPLPFAGSGWDPLGAGPCPLHLAKLGPVQICIGARCVRMAGLMIQSLCQSSGDASSLPWLCTLHINVDNAHQLWLGSFCAYCLPQSQVQVGGNGCTCTHL